MRRSCITQSKKKFHQNDGDRGQRKTVLTFYAAELDCRDLISARAVLAIKYKYCFSFGN